MRRVPLAVLAAAVLGAGLSGCWDGVPNPFAQKTAKPLAVAAAAPAATPAPAPAPAPATAPAAEAAASPAAAVTPVSSPAAAPEVVRWNPAQWPREEHRLAALIANAETRDTIGDTHRVVSDADARRQRCTTRACIQRVYAEEEAWLRQWEGSADVR
jgi:hypothetical protein